MPCASCVVAFTSPLIGPSTISVISLITSAKSLPDFAIKDGLVVTPQITPMSFAFLISSTIAVSTKNFIIAVLLPFLRMSHFIWLHLILYLLVSFCNSISCFYIEDKRKLVQYCGVFLPAAHCPALHYSTLFKKSTVLVSFGCTMTSSGVPCSTI